MVRGSLTNEAICSRRIWKPYLRGSVIAAPYGPRSAIEAFPEVRRLAQELPQLGGLRRAQAVFPSVPVPLGRAWTAPPVEAAATVGHRRGLALRPPPRPCKAARR